MVGVLLDFYHIVFILIVYYNDNAMGTTSEDGNIYDYTNEWTIPLVILMKFYFQHLI